MQTKIKTLYKQGYNKLQIGRRLDIDRKTARKIIDSQEGGNSEVPKKFSCGMVISHSSCSLKFDNLHGIISLMNWDLARRHTNWNLQRRM